MNKDKSDVQQKAERIHALLDDIEPILNAHGYTWGTVYGEDDYGCFRIYIMPREEDYVADALNTAIKALENAKPQTIGCFNCKHDYKRMTEDPCKYCNEKFSKWEAEGGRE